MTWQFRCLWSKLDMFLHKTCLLVEVMGYDEKIISLSYELFFQMKCGRLICLRVRNPTKLSLHQMDFSNSRYSSQNDLRSKLAECETCFLRLWFQSSFFLLPYMYKNIWMLLSNYIEFTSFRPIQLKFCLKYRSNAKYINIRH